jgi:serine/threonine-protein kinase
VKSVGRYEIIEKLGQGGMGTVYKAFDPLLTRVVAIKVISGQLDTQPEHRERFFREARAAAQLSHRSIITIHDLGEHEGAPFLAMEYLEGRDLDRRLRDREPMSLAQKLELALSIAEGICHAHACGVVHRDIKPANVFVTNDGLVKILDFGLARVVSSDMTRSGLMVGTVNYMAPEQLRGEKSDHRADIFAYGVLLYELLSGKRPFQGETAAATMYKILHESPEPLGLVDPLLTPPLTTLVERAMAKAREDRYQHMTDLLRDLESAYEPLSGSVRRLTNRVSVARPITDPMAVTQLTPGPVAPDAPTISEETVPVDDAWKLAEGSLPKTATVMPPARPASSPAPPLAAGPGSASVGAPRPPIGRVVIIAGMALLAALAAVGVYSLRGSAPRGAEAPPPQVQEDARGAEATPPQVQEDARGAEATPPQVQEGARGAEAPPPQAQAEARGAEAPPPRSSRSDESARATESARQERAARQAREASTAADRQRATAAIAAIDAARAGADAVNARELAAQLYTAAERQESLARDDLRQERFVAAAGRLDAAASLYKSAESAARAEADLRATRARLQEENRLRAEEAARTPPPAPRVEPRPEPVRPEPVPAAPAAPAGPPPQEVIAAVIDRYRAALEQRSMSALKAVWPGLSGAQQAAIESDFANARSIDVEMASPRITVSGGTATVVTRRQYQLRTRDGQQLRSESITTMTLRQSGSAWVIESVRYQPVN